MPVLHNYLCKTGIVRAERMGCASHRFAGLLRVSLSFLYESYIPGVSVVDAACMPDNSPHNFFSFSGLHVQIHVDAGCRLNLLFTFRGNETGHVGMGKGYEILHIPAPEKFQSPVAGKQQFQRFSLFFPLLPSE